MRRRTIRTRRSGITSSIPPWVEIKETAETARKARSRARVGSLRILARLLGHHAAGIEQPHGDEVMIIRAHAHRAGSKARVAFAIEPDRPTLAAVRGAGG